MTFHSEIERGPGRPSTKGYRLEDGTRVPSVTTVTGRFGDKGALIGWAAKMAREGKSHRKVSARASAIGTIVHDCMEAVIHGDAPEPVFRRGVVDASDHLDAEFISEARLSLGSAVEWWMSSNLITIATEIPLVSETHAFGGTPDLIARDDEGRLVIIDLKSSSGTYAEHYVQLCGYAILAADVRGWHAQRVQVARFGKDGATETPWWGGLQPGADYFLHLLEAYQAEKAVNAEFRVGIRRPGLDGGHAL